MAPPCWSTEGVCANENPGEVVAVASGHARWNFEGRVVVVTAADSPRGRAQVAGFAAAGAAVYACHGAGRAPDLPIWPPEVVSVAVDLCTEAGAAELTERVERRHGRLDALVVNDPGDSDAAFVDVTDAVWQQRVRNGLSAAFLAAKYLSGLMIPQRYGKIIFTTGPESSVGLPGRVHVCAVRHGVCGLAKVLAIELAEHQVNVNVAAAADVVDLQADATSIAALTSQVLWLAGDAGRFVTGGVVHADHESRSLVG